MAEGMLRISEFRGLDQSTDELSIGEAFSPDMQNVDCEDGALRVMRGSKKYMQEAVPGGIHSLAALYSRSAPRLLAGNENGIWCYQDGAWSQISAAACDRLTFLNYTHNGEDIVLLAGGGPLLMWDGQGMAKEVDGAPTGLRHLALHYERVWGGGIVDEPDTVYWSRAYNPTDWSTDSKIPEAGGGFVLVPTFNGGRVRGIKNFFNDVVVFKDQDIFRIYGTYPGNYEVVRVHGVVGPVAERTVVPWGDRVYFLAQEGLCVYDGVRAQPVDKGRMRKFFAGIDFERARKTACAAFYGDRLCLALPEGDSGHNNVVLEVDVRRDVWMLRRGLRVEDFLPWEGKLLFADGSGHVLAYDEGDSYDGEPIHAYWQSKWMHFNKLGVNKRAGEIRMLGSGKVMLSQETEQSRHMRTVNLGEGLRLRRAPLRGTGRQLRLRMENLDGQPFHLRGGIEWSMELDED